MISVIIPSYNAEKTLKRCINSILSQSYKEFEIIIVDDHSIDDTRSIIEKYIVRYKNIRLISNPINLGANRSRIIGIENSYGEYITFIDSDDTFRPLALQKLKETINDADIAVMNAQYRFTFLGIPKIMKNKMPRELQNEKLRDALISFLGKEDYVPVQVWGKLYKASLLKSIQIPNYNLIWGEDRLFNLILFDKANKVIMTPYVGYNYYWGGITTTYNIDDYKKYDYFYSIMADEAISLGLNKYLPTLKSKIDDFFLYFVRNCIAYLSISKDRIIEIIATRNNLSILEGEKIYNLQYNIVKRRKLIYWLKKYL